MKDLSSVCARAFSKWQAIFHFTFREIQDVDSAGIKIGFFLGSHGDKSPFDGMGGTLAHAFAPTRGLFHFDADEKWGINSSSKDLIDLESVAVHDHSADRNAIMCPSISRGERKVTLGSDDIEGIKALYNL